MLRHIPRDYSLFPIARKDNRALLATTGQRGGIIDINRSGLPARMFFALKLALSVENNKG